MRRLLGLLCTVVLAIPSAARAETFAVYGDVRDDEARHRSIVESIRRSKPDFVLFTGDAVKDGSSAAQWKAFSLIEAPLRAEVPFFGVRGNHDTGGLWEKTFPIPPEGTRGKYTYAFERAGLLFVGIDTELPLEPGSDQRRFISRELSHARVVGMPAVVFMHRAVQSSGHHGGSDALRASLLPLFVKHRVLAVFQSHDHDLERTVPIEGVTYFVSGGGGSRIREFEGQKPEWSAFRLAGHGYSLVDVLPDGLRVRTLDATDLTVDVAQLPFGERTKPTVVLEDPEPEVVAAAVVAPAEEAPAATEPAPAPAPAFDGAVFVLLGIPLVALGLLLPERRRGA